MDDRAGTSAPDGRINIFAADARVNAGRFGHLYLAYSYTDALQARAVSRIISVLNAPGGLGLMQNYLGLNSGGTGTLGTLGFQYDLSIGKLVSYPVPFSGDGPDLFVSVFGMFTHVTSADPGVDPATANVMAGVTGHPWSGTDKRKVGVEADVQPAALAGDVAALRPRRSADRRRALQLRGRLAARDPADRLAGDRPDRHPVLALVQRLEHAGAHRRSADGRSGAGSRRRHALDLRQHVVVRTGP